ncbi:AEC family transporter [Allochromatium vinosum]|uniref:Auxin Efflux Carrier n=1 Tax=Allochromatium vinosum (strain ATCC 17899 / DSM 180 / NBRC 103801 / NCIMB 10441 / D) TaxID=572477 RepID=D3RMT9_ALLVD|nr:AEC family transporter [Allochromatium vinosum]ADC63227.1 Auxin Efflux Carrier [Allochromatium vinosum DSM 180]
MLAILAVTAPIFLLIALGFAAVRRAWMPREGAVAMSRYALLFALPALLFDTLSKRSLDSILVPDFLLVYVSASLITYGIGVLVASIARRTSPLDNAFFGMGLSMSNSSYIGYPLVAQLLGDSALIAVVMAILTEVLIILPLTLILTEFHRERGRGSMLRTLGRVLRTVGTNPILLAIAAGLAFSALGWHLPVAIGRTIELLAGSAAVVALFAIGGSLAGQRVRGALGPATAIATGKLVVHPLVAFGMLMLVPTLDPTLGQAALILAGLPMVTIFPLIAQRYDQGEIPATALVITTLLAFVTLNLGLWLWGIGVPG